MAFRQKVIVGGISFLGGIFSASLGWNFYSSLAGFGLLLVFSSAYYHSKQKLYFKNWPSLFSLTLAFLTLFTLGNFYNHFYLNLKNQNQEIIYDHDISYLGVISKNPEKRETYQKLTLTLEAPYRGKVSVLTNPLITYRYGDLLSINGSIEENQTEGQPPVSFFPVVKVLEENHGFWLKNKLYQLKNNLTGQFKKQLGSNQTALVAGITFGERSDFTPELKDAMAKSGVTHIVALSGYNIAILVVAIDRLLKNLINRRKRFVLTLLVIFLFVLMVGGEASVVRAAIMGSLVLVAQQIGRPHDTLYLIVITALAMVLINPTILVFDIGFQLSFLSLLGIIYLEPPLKKILRLKESEPESFLSWRENGLTTIAAQLAVIPILIYNFDQFSVTAILANMLILSTVPLTMLFGFVLSILNSISYFLGFLIAQILNLLTLYQISIIKIFSILYIPLPGFSFLKNTFIFIIYYSFILWLAFAKHEKSGLNHNN